MAKNLSGSAHANRVRENQRRCRARKHEYVVSLEERLRRCQEAGVKANVELQEAAQRVVDENRELRALLHRQGLSDYDIQVKLSVLRDAQGARLLPKSTRREFGVPAASRLVPDTSQRSEEKFVARLAHEARTDRPLQYQGSEFIDPFNPMLLSPLNSLQHFTWDINSLPTPSTTSPSLAAPSPAAPPPSTQMTVADSQYTPSQPLSSTSDMGIFCSLFAPSPAIAASPDSPRCCSSSTPSESSANIGEQSSSTPCSVAYSLLTKLNLRRRQQEDIVVVLLELMGGFCAVPDGDADGCRVDNDILVPVMNKLLIE